VSDSPQDRSAVDVRRVREKRADATIEIPFGERVQYKCPECGGSFETSIYGADRSAPSFDNCSNWDCDAFLKFVADGTGTTDDVETQTQANLTQFAGGEQS